MIAGIKKQDSLLQKNSKIQIEKNWLYQNSKPVKKHSRIEESKSSFRSFRGSKTRKQIPSNPSLPRNKSHHPPGCRCKWPSPNLRMGQPLPPATGVVYNAFQRIILRQSKGLRSPRFLHPPLRVPEFTEKERERMKNCRAYPQPPATRLATIVRTSWEFALPERKTRGARHEGFRCEWIT